MNQTDKYYARELLELAKPSMMFKHFGGEWEKRDLPWLLRVWPLRKFIRQWRLVPVKFSPVCGEIIKFRRPYEKETNSKHD